MGRRKIVVGASMMVGIALLGVTVSAMQAPSQCGRGGPALCTVTVGRTPVGIGVDPRSGHAFVVNRDSGTVSMLDTRSGTVVRTTTVGDYALGPVVAPQARRIFVYKDNVPVPGIPATVLTMLDTRSGAVVHTVDIGVHPTALAVDNHTGQLFVGASTPTLLALDARSGRVVYRALLVGAAQRIVVDERQGHAFIIMDRLVAPGVTSITPSAAAVSMMDVRTGRVLRTVRVGRSPTAAAIDGRTGRLFVVNADDNTVSVLDTHSGYTVRTVRLGSPVNCGPVVWNGCPTGVGLAVDAAAGRVIVVTAYDARAWLLDGLTGRIVTAVALGGAPNKEWWGPDVIDEQSARAFIVGADRTRVLDIHNGHLLHTIDIGGDAVALDSQTGHVFVTRDKDLSSPAGTIGALRQLVSKDNSAVYGGVSMLDAMR